MARPVVEQPLSHCMTLTLRLQRYAEVSKRIAAPRKKRIKEQLGAVMAELQEADRTGK